MTDLADVDDAWTIRSAQLQHTAHALGDLHLLEYMSHRACVPFRHETASYEPGHDACAGVTLGAQG